MPTCLSCGLRLPPGTGRCGLDGSLAFLAQCPSCQGEVGPKDRFCGHCRQDLRTETVRLRPASLVGATVWRRLGALFFDVAITVFIVGWILGIETWWMQLSAVITLLPLLAAFFETFADATPGQQIFGLKRLYSDGSPLTRKSYSACFLAAGSGLLGPARSEKISSTRLFRVPR